MVCSLAAAFRSNFFAVVVVALKDPKKLTHVFLEAFRLFGIKQMRVPVDNLVNSFLARNEFLSDIFGNLCIAAISLVSPLCHLLYFPLGIARCIWRIYDTSHIKVIRDCDVSALLC